MIFFFKQKTAYEIGLGIPAEPLFRSRQRRPSTPVIAGDSFEMDAVGALRLSPLRRGLAIEIGRASCRERVYSSVFGALVKNGSGLLDGPLQSDTSSVSCMLLALLGIG